MITISPRHRLTALMTAYVDAPLDAELQVWAITGPEYPQGIALRMGIRPTDGNMPDIIVSREVAVAIAETILETAIEKNFDLSQHRLDTFVTTLRRGIEVMDIIVAPPDMATDAAPGPTLH